MDMMEFILGPLLLAAFPIVVFGILIVVAPDGVDLDEIVAPDAGTEWPRGIQEEEPVSWNLDRLSRPRRSPPADLAADAPLGAGNAALGRRA